MNAETEMNTSDGLGAAVDPLAELQRACDYHPDGEGSMDALIAYKDALEDKVRDTEAALAKARKDGREEVREGLKSSAADQAATQAYTEKAGSVNWPALRAAFEAALKSLVLSEGIGSGADVSPAGKEPGFAPPSPAPVDVRDASAAPSVELSLRRTEAEYFLGVPHSELLEQVDEGDWQEFQRRLQAALDSLTKEQRYREALEEIKTLPYARPVSIQRIAREALRGTS